MIITALHLPATLFPTQPCCTISLTQMAFCCWLTFSTASTITPTPFHQDGYSHSHLPAHTNAGGYSTSGVGPCTLPSFPRLLLAQSSSLSRFLCTEALLFSTWMTFPNLGLSPDLSRTCFMSWMVSKEYSEQCGLQYWPCLLAATNHVPLLTNFLPVNSPFVQPICSSCQRTRSEF